MARTPIFDKSDAKLRIGLVTSLLGLLISPNYNPAEEEQKLLLVLEQMKKDRQWQVLEVLSRYAATLTDNPTSEQSFGDKAEALLRKMFSTQAAPETTNDAGLGTTDLEAGINTAANDVYTKAAQQLHDVPLNEGVRVTGRPAALAAGYGVEQEELSEMIKGIEAIEGCALTASKRSEVAHLSRVATDSKQPQVFTLHNGKPPLLDRTQAR